MFLFLAGVALIIAAVLYRPSPPAPSLAGLRHQIADNGVAIRADGAYIQTLEAQIRALGAQPAAPVSSGTTTPAAVPAVPAASPPAPAPPPTTAPCAVSVLGLCVP